MNSSTGKQKDSSSRRIVIGTFGSAFCASILAACASSSKEDENNQSNNSLNFTFDNYDKTRGTYQPATQDTPAKNVPYPLEPPTIRNFTREGLVAAISYWEACKKYYALSGDNSVAKTINYHKSSSSSPAGNYPKITDADKDKMIESKTWTIQIERNIIPITTDPIQNGNLFCWAFKLEGKHQYLTNGELMTKNYSSTDKDSNKVIYQLTYTDRWVLIYNFET